MTSPRQIKLPVLKWYIQASSYAYYLVALVALLFFIAGQASTNIWLSIWSNDATTSQGNDPDLLALRLGVYGGLGMTQGTCMTMLSAAVFAWRTRIGT